MIETKMAEELDRVRISAAELRAEASNLVNTSASQKAQQDERRGQRRQQQPRHHRDPKHPDLQLYTPGSAQAQHPGGGPEGGPAETQGDRGPPSEKDPDSRSCDDDGGAGRLRGNGDRGRAEAGAKPVNQNHRKTPSSSGPAPHQGSGDKEGAPAEGGGDSPRSPKPARKARKPDREIYQPGSRRSAQGKEAAVGREGDVAPHAAEPAKRQADAQAEEKQEGEKDAAPQTEVKKEREERGKGGRGGERSRRPAKREGEKAGSFHEGPTVEDLTEQVDKLNVKEEGKKGGGEEKRAVEEEAHGSREKAGGEGRRSHAGGRGGGGTNNGPGKAEEKRRERGNRRRRGGEKEGIQESRRGRAGGAGGRNEWGAAEGVRDRAEQRDCDQGVNDNNNSVGQNQQQQQQQQRTRERPNANPTTPSKRYSKSDIRRPRNRTYSTSSASSGTSLDRPGRHGAGPGTAEDRGGARRPGLGHREHVEGRRGGGGGGRGGGVGSQRQNRRSNRDSPRRMSSTDSPEEGSETSDRAEEDKRRRSRRRREVVEEEDWSPERRREDENRGWAIQRGGGGRGGRGGILSVSLEKHTASSPAGQREREAHQQQGRRQGVGPGGRGRGILVLPAHTNLTNNPEPAPRLLFGGIRGRATDRGGGGGGRGGRGGGNRRLWDPNNPDQKPALRPSSQHAPHHQQQPMYLQTGVGYGALHFLDTDDEAAGSPPVHQGEHFQNQQQQQAAAMAFYKFQNSDNPYGYPVANTAVNNNPNPRYAYPYHMAGPYQMGPTSNGMYPTPGMGPFYGGYRAPGYPPAALAGGAVSPEEAELQTRGELGRLLRAADTQELQLSNLLSRERLSPDGLDRMAQLRADLLTLYERVILTDIEFSDSQNLDQALWKNVFHQVIEHFRQLLKEPDAVDAENGASCRIRTMLLTLLDEGALFFEALLQKLQTVFQFKLEEYMDGVAIRARPLRKQVKYALISAQRCMICQGDIARYREQASDSANYGKARSWYLKAQQIAPKNGRPYNQLALLAVYTKRKLDAVYYYMRSLAASNPILTARESLMSLFEEAKRKADQLERKRRQDSEGGSRGPAVRGGGGRGAGGEEGARVEIWVRPSSQTGAPLSSRRRGGGSESSRDSEQDGELGSLSASDLNKRFILSFLHAHGKLFTKVGMESFPDVASRVLQEFGALLQHAPCPLGSTRLLQIITINMFTIHHAHSRDKDSEARSVLREQTTSLGLAMFGLLVQRCTQLLLQTPAEPLRVEDEEEDEEEEERMVRVSSFPLEIRELLPTIKVWSDWMLGHPDQWNPPPQSLDCSLDVWRCLADLCNALARVDHGEAPLYKADQEEEEEEEELRLLLLEEDRLLAGFVPLLAAPQEPCYVDRHTDMAIAADCKRVTVLKYFLEALCGQEEPLLAFKGGKYVSTATTPAPVPSAATPAHETDGRVRVDSQTSDDVIVAEESSLSASEGEGPADEDEEGGASGDDIRELRARRHALTSKLAQQQRRRDKIQAVLQTGGQLELEVRPLFLVPDTNGFIDHLDGLKSLLRTSPYILVVPLIVITELDGLAKGQDNLSGGGGGAGGGSRGNASASHARSVQDKARLAVGFLEKGFQAREPRLRALTSRGSQLESIAFRSEDTSGQQGTNDDVILSCCLHYCKDKAKDYMPTQKNGPVRLRREVVLLTDDRNLRVKALTRNVPVRDIPAFLTWAKVG